MEYKLQTMYNDKAALIKSMNNLLRHITSSRQAQQEIFNSLEQKDFDKIVSNLTDPILQLRLTSARLIGQLLTENQNLQYRFCQIMNIYFSNDTQIIVNNNFDKIIQSYPHRAGQIFKLLKTHNKVSINYKKIDALIWFINPQKDMLSVEYLSEQQISNLIKTYQLNQNPEDICFDPIYCIFGILLRTKEKLQQQKYRSTQNTQLGDSVKYYDNNQLSYFQPYVPRMQKVFNNPQFPLNINITPQRVVKNVQINWGTPVSIKFQNNSAQHSFIQQKLQNSLRSSRKISLTQYRRKSNLQQTSHGKFINDLTKSNNITERINIISKQKPKEISRSFNATQTYNQRPPHLNNLNYSLTVKNSHNPHQRHFQFIRKQEEGNDGYTLIAPSLKVKSIAMNGRQGWQTTKNINIKQQNLPHNINFV